MYKITDIQLFDYAEQVQINDDGDCKIKYSYSVNIAINNEFMAQCWAKYDLDGKLEESDFDIPAASEAFWNSEEKQDAAHENINAGELLAALAAQGFENNIEYFDERGCETMNPENKQYRPL